MKQFLFAGLVATLALVQPVHAVPVTFQIEGEFKGAVDFSGTWEDVNLLLGDPYVAFLTIDDAASPINSYDDYPTQRINEFAITGFDITFTRNNASVDLPTGTLNSRVLDYDSDIGVSLNASGTQADGSSVSIFNTQLAYQDRSFVSEPSLEEAIYLLDQQSASTAGGLLAIHNGGVWDYGSCLIAPDKDIGQCGLALTMTSITIATPGYVVQVPDGVANPVLAPVPLPASLPMLAMGLLGIGAMVKRRKEKS